MKIQDLKEKKKKTIEYVSFRKLKVYENNN